MKVLFVYSLRDALTLRKPLASLGDIHIGLSYLSAYLRGQKHSTRLVVLNSELAEQSAGLLREALESCRPDAVACTAVSTQFPFIREAARQVKKTLPGIPVLIGGAHASLNPEEVCADPFDAVCVGEGEKPLAEYLEQLQRGVKPQGIPNLWIRRAEGTLEKNPPREFLADLELPFLDREMWVEWVMARQHTSHVVLPSRGCPYSCSYCCNHALRKLARGKYVRFRPAADVLKEIRFLKESYPETSHIYLQSETLMVDLEWLRELTCGIKAMNDGLSEPIHYTCNLRVTRALLSEEVFGLLKQGGVTAVEIGLESGSERVRKEVLRRQYSNEEFLRAIELARRYGMRVNLYNMIGLPDETPQDHLETVRLNNLVCPDRPLTSIFFPYPGTDLYETCKARGLIPADGNMTAERYRAMIGFPTFSKREVQRAFDWFDYTIYRGHRSWLYRMRCVLRNKAYSHAWSHRVFLSLLPLWHKLRGRRE